MRIFLSAWSEIKKKEWALLSQEVLKIRVKNIFIRATECKYLETGNGLFLLANKRTGLWPFVRLSSVVSLVVVSFVKIFLVNIKLIDLIKYPTTTLWENILDAYI